jgi:hypothetical protein
MTSTHCGVSAKHFERERGVACKAAWQMFKLIRNKLMTRVLYLDFARTLLVVPHWVEHRR